MPSISSSVVNAFSTDDFPAPGAPMIKSAVAGQLSPRAMTITRALPRNAVTLEAPLLTLALREIRQSTLAVSPGACSPRGESVLVSFVFRARGCDSFDRAP
jgi:hypothetical protein